MTKTTITRQLLVPDPVRISRCQRAPELGPRILFFSGGSALNELSSWLKDYTYNSIHLVTPFDSGGSSATLRQALAMPAIGDLRSRMMALADDSITGNPEVYRLFSYRLPKEAPQSELKLRLRDMCDGLDDMVDAVPNPMRRIICNSLKNFAMFMPADFNLQGASIGNLVLAGGYLIHRRHLDSIIYLFSKLVGVKGEVQACVEVDMHLVATLEDGTTVVGQHNLTGKEVQPIKSKVVKLGLSSSLESAEPVSVQVEKNTRRNIRSADLICYPPGSFYSSLVANLLPEGVCESIASNAGPKVYIPNLGADPEQIGMDLGDCIDTLLDYLQRQVPAAEPGDFLNFVLLDSNSGHDPAPLLQRLDALGIQVIDTQLVSSADQRHYDPALLGSALLSLT